MASSLEGVIWLVFGLIWVAAQLLQRSMKKNRRAPGPPTLPGLPGDAEHRDLDDFLAEMLERAAPEIKPATPPAAPPPVPRPVARPAPAGLADKSHKRKIAMPARPAMARAAAPTPSKPAAPAAALSRPARQPAGLQTAPAKARAPQLAQGIRGLQAGASLRNAALPAMPAMQPQPFTNRPPHALTAALKSAAGMRRAIFWREVVEKPRALQPY